jgi:hypothetical protein
LDEVIPGNHMLRDKLKHQEFWKHDDSVSQRYCISTDGKATHNKSWAILKSGVNGAQGRPKVVNKISVSCFQGRKSN